MEMERRGVTDIDREREVVWFETGLCGGGRGEW